MSKLIALTDDEIALLKGLFEHELRKCAIRANSKAGQKRQNLIRDLEYKFSHLEKFCLYQDHSGNFTLVKLGK